ncbi:MAG TPA: acyltransferase, partial [Polyangiaceae bacterium]|nr:acyltransferase [Polyangiaceae bacterium]
MDESLAVAGRTNTLEKQASAGPIRFHQLDGLRAIAASLVVAHHLGTTKIGEAALARGHYVLGFFMGTVGSSGVELFFVLSGLLLCRPYLREGRRFDLRRYVDRRAVRLFPPYLVAWLACGVFLGVAWLFPTWWTANAWLPPFRWVPWLSQVGIVYFGTHWCFA